MLKLERLSIIMLLSVLSIFFYSRTFFDFPNYTHSWTQSGYYALALGFIANDFNFFLPNTPNLNPQFPAKKELTARKGITSVDFPIHPYLVSIIAFITGNKSPFVFRLYNLLWGIVGMYFLFLLSKNITNSFLKSLFVVLFAFTSPVYIYYQAGFIPSIPSFSAAIIGIYYFLQHKKTEKHKFILLSVLFLTLSALARLPFAIFLLSAFFLSMAEWLRKRKINRNVFILYVLSFLFLLAYFLYNNYLAREYGTMFLGRLMPADNWNEFTDNFNLIIENWKYHFFTSPHYISFLICFLLCLYFLVRERIVSPEIKRLFIYFLISAAGAISYFMLMEQQYVDHDYYFLDSFFIPLILLFLIMIHAIRIKGVVREGIFIILAIFFSTGFIIKSKTIQDDRHILNPWDRGQIVVNDFYDSEKYIDSLHIPATAKILAIETYNPYSSLILMGRKGYTVIMTDRKNLKKAFGCDFDYMAMPNDLSVSDVIRNYPEMLSVLRKIGDNGKISIYKKDSSLNNKSLHDFLGITSSGIQHEARVVSDSTYKNCELLNDSTEFSKTFSIKAKGIAKGLEKILFTSDIHFLAEENNLQAICLLKRESETIYYACFPITEKTSGWQISEQQFRLPENISAEDEISVYLWNAGKRKIRYCNMEIIIYK